MTFSALLNLIGLFLGLVAGGFFVLGASDMKAADIAALTQSGYDDNPGFRTYLVKLKADYLCGGFAFLLAFVFQLLGAAPGPGIPATPQVVANNAVGVGIAASLSALVGYLLWLNRRRVINSLRNELSEF